MKSASKVKSMLWKYMLLQDFAYFGLWMTGSPVGEASCVTADGCKSKSYYKDATFQDFSQFQYFWANLPLKFDRILKTKGQKNMRFQALVETQITPISFQQ